MSGSPAARIERPSMKLYHRVNDAMFLRPISIDDVTESYVLGLRDPEVTQFMFGVREREQTMETVCAYVSACEKAEADVLFGVFIDDQLRGTVRMHDIDVDGRICDIGICLFDKNYWSKGYARKSLSAITSIGFDHFGLITMRAGVNAANIGSAKTFEKAGFVHAPELRYQIGSSDVEVFVFHHPDFAPQHVATGRA